MVSAVSSVVPQEATTKPRTTMDTLKQASFTWLPTNTSQRVGGPDPEPTVLYRAGRLHYVRKRYEPGAGSQCGMTEKQVGKKK